MVRAERAGWLGVTSELRDGGSLKNGLVADQIVAGQSFASGDRLTRLPNRLGADFRISPAGDGSSGRAATRSFFRAAKREPRDERLDRPDERTPTEFTDCDTVRVERADRLEVTSAQKSFLRPDPHVPKALHLFAAAEVFQLEELTNLDLAFFGLTEGCGKPSRPFHRLFS